MRDGAERRDFPIAEMACEEDRRLAVVAQVIENLLGPRAELDTARLVRMIGVVVPDVVEMGELGADAAEIVPDAGQDFFDLFRRFFREGGREVLAADPVLAQPAADEAGDAAEEIGGLVRIEIARRAQQGDRQRADGGFRRSAWRRRASAPWCEGAGGSFYS